jgi:ribosomal protein S8
LYYVKAKEVKKYCFGKSVYLISTPFGLMTNKEALEKNTGGKLLLSIS